MIVEVKEGDQEEEDDNDILCSMMISEVYYLKYTI
jgi:hypothetical protein